MAAQYYLAVLTVQKPVDHWTPPETYAEVYDLEQRRSARVVYLECLVHAAKQPGFEAFEPNELVVLHWSLTPMFAK